MLLRKLALGSTLLELLLDSRGRIEDGFPQRACQDPNGCMVVLTGAMREGRKNRHMYRKAEVTWAVCFDGDAPAGAQNGRIYFIHLNSGSG